MHLPSDFQFSQASLQDYADCPRRFQLRYVRRLRWPAIETEPALANERHLRLGAAFHRLIRQQTMGVSVTMLSRMVTDAELRRWWHSYLESGLMHMPSQRYPEVRLGTSIGTYRLVAQYDLIGVEPGGRVSIVDWKTNRKRPQRSWLAERLQTHVYPYVLVQTGDALEGEEGFPPDQVSMIYWFANYPSAPEQFVYDDMQYRADEDHLRRLVQDIAESLEACGDGELLPPVNDEASCRICRYRSLCARGVEPGWLDETESGAASQEPFDFVLDFEQIGELELG